MTIWETLISAQDQYSPGQIFNMTSAPLTDCHWSCRHSETDRLRQTACGWWESVRSIKAVVLYTVRVQTSTNHNAWSPRPKILVYLDWRQTARIRRQKREDAALFGFLKLPQESKVQPGLRTTASTVNEILMWALGCDHLEASDILMWPKKKAFLLFFFNQVICETYTLHSTRVTSLPTLPTTSGRGRFATLLIFLHPY